MIFGGTFEAGHHTTIFNVLACESLASMKRLPKISVATGLALLVLFMTGCGKPDYPSGQRPRLETTISDDGRMVATLVNAGTDQQRLRIKRLQPDGAWEDVKAPPYTQSIRFGLAGHELLLTHYVPELKQGRLVKIDLGKLPEIQSQTVFQDDYVAIPLEVSPGQFMVRTCPNKNKPGAQQCRLGGVSLVGRRGQRQGRSGRGSF